ncbi:MAG: peroxide stress protein YaaA [Bacteroidota bacterium]
MSSGNCFFVISPAKKLDFQAPAPTAKHSQPILIDDTKELLKKLGKMSAPELSELMGISEKLGELNYERYQTFSLPFTESNAKQALFSFKGDVYLGFEWEKYQETDFDFAQAHLRILSGLYGLLKPLDLIQPYRLEMGTKFQTKRGKNLYEFWGDRIRNLLIGQMEEAGADVLINLASNEYVKALDIKKAPFRTITPVFKDQHNGKFITKFLYAKQARGAMTDFAIRNRISEAEDLKRFEGMGYQFHESFSTENEWVFTR